MAKLLDDNNVHDFWGLSPAIDALDALEHLPASVSQHGVLEVIQQSEAVNFLQVCTN